MPFNWNAWSRLLRRKSAPISRRKNIRPLVESLEDRFLLSTALSPSEIADLEKLGLFIPAGASAPLSCTASTNPYTNQTTVVINGKVSGGNSSNQLTAKLDNGSAAALSIGSGGSFLFTPTGLSDGRHTVLFHASDSMGDTASQTVTFLVNTDPPAITFTSPAANGATKTGTITGSVTDTITPTPISSIHASVDGRTAVNVAFNSTTDKFTFTPTGLSEGLNTVTFTATDKAGNKSSPTTVTFLFDNVPPKVTVTSPAAKGYTQSPIQGTFQDSEDNITSITATVDGKASHNPVTFTPGQSGGFGFPITGLSNGLHTVVFKATDQAGNVGTTTLSFTVATAAPALSVTQPAAPTKTEPKIAGTFSDIAPVTSIVVMVDGNSAGAATFTSGKTGSFSFTPASNLAAGPHTVTFVATDAAGNASTQKSVTYTLANLSPQINITSPANAATLSSSPHIQGTFAGNFDNLVSIAATVDTSAAVQATFTHGPGGTFTFTPGTLAQGPHTVTFVAKDQAGNTNKATLSFTINTHGPALTVTRPSTPTHTDPTINGTFSDGLGDITSIAVTVDGKASGQAVFTPGTGGTFSFATSGLSDGSHTVAFTATDQGGRSSTAQSVSFTLFTALPTVSITTPASPTNHTSKITGTFADTEDNVTAIAVTVDGASTGHATFTAGKSGALSFTPTGLADGPHTVVFTATDQAGNSNSSQPIIFSLFTGHPTLSATVPNHPANQIPTLTGSFNDNEDNITSVAVTVDGHAAGQATFTPGKSGGFHFKPSSLSAGSHTVSFTATDQVGNSSTASSVTFALSSAVVTLSVTPPTSPTNHSPTINGSFNDAKSNITSIAVTVDGASAGQATFTPALSGNISFTPGALADGLHTVTFTATDSANNASTPQSATFTLFTALPTLSINQPTSPTLQPPKITGTFSDTEDNVTSIAVKVDGVVAGQANFTAGQSGSLNFTPGSLSNGPHTVTFTATDQAGNVSAPAPVTFTIGAGPTLTVTAPVSPTNKLPSIAGSFNDGVANVTSIAVTVDGQTAGQAGFTPGASGTFNFVPGALADGPHTVVFTAIDQAGNSSTPQSAVFTLFTDPPTLSVTPPTSPTRTEPKISGTFSDTQDNVTSIAVTMDGISAGQATFSAGQSGSFSFTPAGLADGSHTVSFLATDLAGNTNTQAVTFSLFTALPTLSVTPPVSPTKTAPTLTGSFNDSEDNVASIAVTVDGNAAGQATFTAGKSGAFSFTPGSLSDGTHTVTFTATDQAGNTSTVQSVTFSLFTAIPTVTITAPPTLTNSIPTIAGTFNETEDNVTSIAVTVDGNAGGQATFTSGKSGSLSFKPGTLTDGLHTVSFQATDQAGNVSAIQSVSFTLATAKPVITVSTPLNNNQFFSTAPAISGPFSDAVGVSTIAVSVDGTASGPVTFTPGTSGTFSFTPILATNGSKDGPHTVVFTATDQAGNTSTATSTFNLATQGPALSVSMPADGVATNTNFSIQGLLTDKAGTITQFTATGVNGNLMFSSPPNFTFGTLLNLNGSQDGNYTVVFTAMDSNGNIGSVNFPFTLATKAPVLSITQSPPSPTDVDPTYTGTFSAEVNVTAINVTVDGKSAGQATFTPGTGGSLSYSTSGLSDGTHTIQFFAVDRAGNISGRTFVFVLDNQAPTLSLTQPVSPTNQVPKITGTFSDNFDNVTGIAVTVDGKASGQAAFTTGTSGSFNFTPTGLTDGLHTVAFMATDQAGNVTTAQSVVFELDTLAPALSVTQPASPTNQSPKITGSFNDTEDNVAAIAVTVDGQSGGQATFTPGQSGSFNFTPAGLSDGLHTVVFSATDQAGNTSAPQSATFTLFTAVPTLNVTQPASPTKTAPNITGTFSSTEDNITSIAVIVDGQAAGQATFTPGQNGSFSFTPTGLADGPHTVAFTANDQAGNTSAAKSATFTLFTAVPTLNVTQPTSPTKSLPSINGTFSSSEDNVTSITVTVDGHAAGQATFTPGQNGSFSFTPGALADGLHTVLFTASDQAGNTSAGKSATFTLFTALPTLNVTAPASPMKAVPNITGSFSSTEDNITSIAASVDGTPAGQAVFTPGQNGTFNFTPGSLADGPHTVVFTATDQAGNTSAAKSASFTLFTAAPTLGVTPLAASTKTVPNITGSFSSTEDNITSIAVTVDGNPAGQATFTPGQNGSFNFTPGALSDGPHTVVFIATDQAGNTSAAQSRTFSLFTATPTLSVAQPTTPTRQNDVITGTFNDTDTGDSITAIAVTVDGAPAGQATFTPGQSGTFSFTTSLKTDGSNDGSHTVAFTATDRVGNISSTSSVAFLLDTLGPVITLVPPAPLTHSNPLTLTGTVSPKIPGVPVATLQAQVDSGAFTNVAFNAQTGAFVFTPSLADGSHVITFQATDALGNVTTAADSFLLDTHAPTVTITSPATSSTTVSQSPTITGTLADASPSSGLASLTASVNGGAPVTLQSFSSSPGSLVTGGNFSFKPNLTADGVYTVTFTLTDNAGNSTTSSVTIALDAAGPQVSITSPPPNALISHSPVVTGQITDAGSSVSSAQAILDGGAPVSITATPNGTGQWTFSFPTNLPVNGSADGPHTVQITVTDQFGKTNSVSVSFTLGSIASVLNLGAQVQIITSEAFDPNTGMLYVGNYSTIYQVNPINGSIVTSYNMPGGGSNAMQVLPAALTLGTTTVPAGSLLVFNSAGSPGQLFALNPNTGAVLATMALPASVSDAVGIAYSPATNTVYMLLSGANLVVGINPANGAIVSEFAAPYQIGYGGLALDPNNGDLWIASIYTNTLYQVDPTTGAVLQQVSVANQGPEWNITGLVLLGGPPNSLIGAVTTVTGVVYKVIV